MAKVYAELIRKGLKAIGDVLKALQAEVKELLEAAAPFVGGAFRGIRISTRPDAVDGETLGLLRRYGVTAVELGAQSMDDTP